MPDDCSKSAKFVAYFISTVNLVCGLLNLIVGIYMVSSFQIAGGVISFFAGAFLLIGIIKDSAKIVLVYLITETVFLCLGTICGLLLMIILVTVSSRIIEGHIDVKIGKTIVVDKYLAGLVAFVVLVVIIVSWIVHFLLYVFYGDVATRNKEEARRGSSMAVRYNVFGDMNAGEGNVVFPIRHSSPLV